MALILLLTGVFAIAFQDSLVKLMSGHTSFWQFQILRSLGNLSFVTILAFFSGGIGLLIPRNWRPVYLRAGILLVCMFFFFSGALVSLVGAYHVLLQVLYTCLMGNKQLLEYMAVT